MIYGDRDWRCNCKPAYPLRPQVETSQEKNAKIVSLHLTNNRRARRRKSYSLPALVTLSLFYRPLRFQRVRPPSTTVIHPAHRSNTPTYATLLHARLRRRSRSQLVSARNCMFLCSFPSRLFCSVELTSAGPSDIQPRSPRSRRRNRNRSRLPHHHQRQTG